MSKEIIDETLAITGEIEDQLKFYREIGLEDIGGSGRAAESAPTAYSTDSTASGSASAGAPAEAQAPPAAPRVRYEDSTQQRASQIEQADLFGEVNQTSQGGSSRVGRPALTVIESQDASLDAIREDIGDCRRCKLCEHRRTIVFGEGNPKARLVFVGEGPGADEDASGRPFVGRAGQLLDKIIAAIGLKREEVYIANVVKCRPPGNRPPEPGEVGTCEPFLFRQLAFIHPQVIVALGAPAFQCLVKTKEPIGRARGEWREWNGAKLMPTFHPAFLLRSPDKKREVWEDMKKVRDYLNARV
jgi:uracil-DNA glycosylase family 4